MGFEKIQQGLRLLVLVLMIWLSASGLLEKAAGYLGADRANAYNTAYIDQSFDAAMNGFLILSAIKSGLAVIEGSEVGLGFNLEVGDVVQSVYDYVDIAWKTALMGGTVLILTQLLLQSVGLLNHWCLALMFLLLLVMNIQTLYTKKDISPRSLVKQLFSMVTVMTLALYIIFPLSIRGAAWLSGKITNPLLTEARQGFSSVKDDLSVDTLSKKLFSDDPGGAESFLDKLNLGAQYTKIKKHLDDLGGYLAKKAEEIAVWTVKLIAGYLFDCLIFPIIFFVLLYLFTRFSFQYLLDMSLSGYRARVVGQA
ncbi:MAG: hypothetical protein KKD44_13710 [Proteobacteria bacterium]|nr:hypothetical protein [Pseudomonadota bacterium]